jgi:4-amino-4-deoxy-L-arabinose transferase-like glycosyltransferase
LIVVCAVLNGIVLLNACLHDPSVGYDAHQHLAYAETLASGRLPTPGDSLEFFSPPLPYSVPAVLMALGLDLERAAAGAQLFNVLLSVGVTWLVVGMAGLAGGGDALKIGAVALLASFPVYFKTFALVRGEPWLAFFAVLAAWLTLRMVRSAEARPAAAIAAGAALGLALLSRQWGFLLAPAIVVLVAVVAWHDGARRRALTLALALLLGTAAVTAGWFYLRLPAEEGGVLAFNRRPSPQWSLLNQPTHFYLGLGLDRLFCDPVRPSFPNQLLPTFYAETWGDYWGIFVVYARDAKTGQFLRARRLEEALTEDPRPGVYVTNRDRIAPYLGRVNVAALAPFGLALAGLGLGTARLFRFAARATPETAVPALFTLVVAASFAGYFLFLVRYPELGRGDTIKATYMLQAFPFLALLGAAALVELERRSRRWHRAAVVLLLLAWMHNLPAMITRHVR